MPATAMQAGVAAPHDSTASQFFLDAVQALSDSGLMYSNWGPPNYLDYGTGLVNMQNPVWGTLEIGQGAVSLLNMLLGGDYIERRDSLHPLKGVQNRNFTRGVC